MRKGIIKEVVLAAVFVLSVFGFSRISNQTNEDLTREMAYAMLPLVSLESEGREVNELRGYQSEMNTPYMRDSITPISEGREIPIIIKAGARGITEIAYQIRSLDGKELLVDSAITEFTQEHGVVRTTIKVQGIVDRNTEYALILMIGDGVGVYRYYTRIIEPEKAYTKECVDFAVDFHQKALNPESYESLSSYLEPDSSADNTTLQKVTIHSSLKQVGYADFKGIEVSAPIPRITEISPYYTVVVLDYVMSRVGQNGENEYYNCEEYFRVRHTEDRDYLLSYERTMEQIYRGEDAYLYGSYIQLGIRDPEVNFLANESSTAVAFEQQGELWCYGIDNNRLTEVFSFRGIEGIDERENYNGHEIEIVSIDGEGSINFVVYGYMNRGTHEGQVGIGVYHFSSVTNTVEEKAFIPASESFGMLRSDLGALMYESEGGQFYLMLAGNVYRIELESGKVSAILSGLPEGSYAVSESNRYLAYISKGDLNSGTELTIYDLETNTSYQVQAEEGEYLRPLDFMEEDLIYGKARVSEILVDRAGTVTYPMYAVCILSAEEEHELLKEYSKPGLYVSDLYVDGYTIYLDRIQFNGTTYIYADQDTIMNREGNTMETITTHSTLTEEKETEIQIDLGTTIKNGNPKLLKPKEVDSGMDRTVNIEIQRKNERFYVYAKGDVLTGTDVLQDSVHEANTACGVVIGSNAQYLWKRARAASKTSIPIEEESMQSSASSISKCISAMLQLEDIVIDVDALLQNGQTPKEILQSSLRGARFMDLSGCSVEETLYYISCGAPVFALSGTDSAVLLVGYDQKSVMIFDPMGGKSSMPMDKAEEFFAETGDVFFTYLKN